MIRAIAILLVCTSCTRIDELSKPAPDVARPAPAVPCASPPPMSAVVPLPGKAVAIAAHEAQACAVLDTGRAVCWGDNGREQLRLAASDGWMPPTDIGLAGVVELSLAASSGCARLASGQVTCWGHALSWHPQPGDAAPQPRVGHVDQISAGVGHNCTLRVGEIACKGFLQRWGGFPAAQSRIAGISGASQVAAGDYIDCALVGGEALCWGNPQQTACYDDCGAVPRAPVARRVPGLSRASALAVGVIDGCAIHGAGRVACFGYSRGYDGPDPAIAIPGIADARQIAVGSRHACAVRATGEVSCWRLGNAAWYGVGRHPGDGITPTVVPGVDRAVAVAAGNGFSCALGSDGRVTCWGLNSHRQLGDTTRAESNDPTTVCGLDHVTQIAVSEHVDCALRDSGDVYCWPGARDLGVGYHPLIAVPVRETHDVAAITANFWATCARDRANAIECWGSGRASMSTSVPDQPFRDFALGHYRWCGATPSGGVVCDGKSLVDITGAARVVAVGDDYVCTLSDLLPQGGAIAKCWGPYEAIQRAERCDCPPGAYCPCPDRTVHPLVPHTVSELPVVDIARCQSWLCARTTDGRTRCVQPNDTFHDTTPVATSCQVWGDGNEVVQAGFASSHGCALHASGLVSCWGGPVGQARW